ncbi:nuclear transport factor 2 family protein [Seonamhaeicola sp.]|uniref:nuclear transport factor 2 family protein n=1 Tax=Seonamhaeicola sp. TaxID=1912245 RepID=UPI00260D34D9|nr:nuclear transport factor 2 family protein [Seonamhaeicola sp.]
MKQILLYGFLLLTMLNGFAQNSLNKQEKEAIISEVQGMLNNYHDAIVKGGINEGLKYLDHSSDFFWVPPRYTEALDYDTVKDILLENSGDVKFIDFSWEKVQIVPITHSVTNYTGIVKCVEVDKNNQPMTFRIIESGTLIKRDDGWKFLSGQTRNLPKH